MQDVYGLLGNHRNFNEWKVVVLDFYTFCGRGKTLLKLRVGEKKTQVPCLISILYITKKVELFVFDKTTL